MEKAFNDLFRTHYRECTYQNFSANTDGYQQVSLSVTPEKTNEIVNYIAFGFVYGYNENEMTVDNAEVNLLKVKLNQSCGKAKMYKSDALNIANSVDSTRSKCDPKHRGSASFKHYHVKYKNIKWSIHSFYV